jgi:hypothetical protein
MPPRCFKNALGFILLGLFGIVSAAWAQPVQVLVSDFDTLTVSGTGASSVEWSTAPDVSVLDAGNLSSLNGYPFGVLGGQSTVNNLTVNNNLNTAGQTATQRGFSMTFSVGAGFYLSKLTVKAGHVSGTGAKQVYVSTLNYRLVRISDSAVIATGNQSFDYAGAATFFDRVFTLSGELEAGVSYRLEVGMNNLVSGGAFAIYDGLTLEGYPEPTSNPSFAQGLNFARFQKPTASFQSTSYFADFAVDGIVSNYHSWRVGSNTNAHWLELTYPREVTLGSAHLYSGVLLAATTQVWQRFRFQYHNGSSWIDIPGSIVTGNTQPERNVLFTSPITASRFRLQSDENVNNRTVRELVLLPPNPNASNVEQGYPIGTDVILNLAYERPVTASSIHGTGYAIQAVDGYVDDASRWFCDDAVPGQTLEIDLLADHAISSAHLHSGFYSGSSDALAHFSLEYWDSVTSAWLSIPGASITGNTALARVIPFSSTVVTSRVRLVISGASAGRVAELQIFGPRTGGVPLGQDIRYEAPPSAAWQDFSDSSYRLRISPTPERRLGLVSGSAIFTDNNAGAAALDWQLLLNHRDGSYRIRHLSTGLCLGLASLSTAADTAVIGETYTGLPHQNWFLEAVTNTRFRLLNGYSGLAIQSLGGSHTVGTPLVVALPSASKLQQWQAEFQAPHPKKGIAATTSIPSPAFADPNATWFSHFYANYQASSWSYTWGRQTRDGMPSLSHDHTHNPMSWGNFGFAHGGAATVESSRRDLLSNPKPVYWLGFNEPDREDQSNMTVAAAIQRWPRLMAQDAPLLGPAPGTTSTTTGWLLEFQAEAEARGFRVDYTAAHWYAGPNADSLINLLQQVYNKWQKPVWLTEFSPVRWSGSASWTRADNYNFLAEFLWRAESLPWLVRYSLFNFRDEPIGAPENPLDTTAAPRGNSIRSDGSLTGYGELYAGWDGVTSVMNQKSYHLHNKKLYRRVQNPASTDLVTSVSPDVSAMGHQWFLIPGSTVGTVRIVSIRDGRRLRYFNGTYVGLAPATNVTAQSEWQLEPDQHGWFFLKHPQSNTRLQMNASGTPVHGSVSGTGDEFKWRFVVPANVEPIIPDSPVVTAQGGIKLITLSWDAVPNAASYTIERLDAGGQSWQSLATGITQTTWSNTALPAATAFSYRVSTVNGVGTSPPSAQVTAATQHPLESLGAWVAEYLAAWPPADQALTADPNQNGIPNLLEYAYSRNPVQAGRSPVQIRSAGANSIEIEFPWNWRATDLSWQVRSGTDVANAAAWPIVVPISIQTSREGDSDRLRLTFPRTSHPHRFYTLEILSGGS